MAFCTLEGENGTQGEAEGAIYPRGCTKPMDPSHSVQQLFCYTCIIVIPLLEVLLSYSNIITTDLSLFYKQTNLEPAVVSYTALEIDQRREQSR